MRYAQIEECEIINGENVGITIWTQGCNRHCPGCHNPETWDFKGGQLFTKTDEDKIYKLLSKPYIKRCSWSGGEPLVDDNLYQLNYILCTIKSNWPDKKVWIWTGYTWDELQERRKNMTSDLLQMTFKYSDYLVAGPFIQEEKDLTLLWRGSRNQEVIDLRQTLAKGEKVLYVR